MKAQTTPKQPVSRRKRSMFLIVFLSLFIGIEALYLLRGVLLAPHLQRYAERLLDDELGMKVSIGGIHGSYITNLDIRDVTTMKPSSSGPLTSVGFRRLHVSYNPLSLLRGLNRFLADAMVELDGARVDLDLSRPSERPDELAKTAPGIPLLPEKLPQIHIQNADLTVQGTDYRASFTGIDLRSGSPKGMDTILFIRISAWEWQHPDIQDGRTSVSAEVRYSKETIALRKVLLRESEVIDHLVVRLAGLPASVPFGAKLYLAGGQLAVDGAFENDNLTAQIQCDQVDVEALSAFLKSPPLSVGGILSMTGRMSLPVERPMDLTAELDIRVEGGRAGKILSDRLHLLAKAADRKIRVRLLDLQTSRNHVLLEGVSVGIPTLLEGTPERLLDTMTGRFSLDCQDIPSLLSLGGIDLRSGMNTIPAHKLLMAGQLQDRHITLSKGALKTDSGRRQDGPKPKRTSLVRHHEGSP